MLRSLWHDQTGLTTAEYAVVLAVMALTSVTVGTLVAARIQAGAGNAVEVIPAA